MNIFLCSFYRWSIVFVSLLFLSINIPAQQDTKIKEKEIEELINELYNEEWLGPVRVSISPTVWEFSFTENMLKILEMGSIAQQPLLKRLSDPLIKDQVIILLGGIGDEQAVDPIIEAMIRAEDISITPDAERINLSANVALTNLTVADVIWPHGGGTVVDRCPETPKECWLNWWKENQATFTIKGITQSRNYGNYPNYGIYRRIVRDSLKN